MRHGDVAFCAGSNPTGWAIRTLTHSPFNHVKVIVSDDGRVIEAVWPRVRLSTLESSDVVVPVPYDGPRDRARAVATAMSWLGKRYSLASVISDLMHFAGFPLTFDVAGEANCAQIVTMAIGFGLDMRTVSPGDIYRLLSAWKEPCP